ncbi:hypothetical protein [Streptomyces acidiscabies]|uniref:Terminase-like family protein n=1 Tax=Streptomyces acidiscabies TaxID=42234 RepID=A0A0L0KJN6_9ACTN|nr:hypothetical protein [Streptomyces acidiscabies]KND38472.1 hypothetical protein IQ63_07505 [Streptomyces acidiscabies]
MTTGTLDTYLAGYDPAWFGVPECRRELTRHNPLLFALTYFPHHLRGDETRGQISLSPVHWDWCEQAQAWMQAPVIPKEQRHAYIAPRAMGKSTWWQLILPLWAAAHGHVRYIAGFASAASQARQRLRDIKMELESNQLLQADYPELCRPARRASGVSDADRQDLYIAQSGFAFTAQGVDSSILGAKVGSQRPDLIVLDDVEPGESNYSPYQMAKRLRTIQDDILPLNVYARVVLVGTTTMPGSITHQLVQAANGLKPEDWILEEQICPHHHRPFRIGDDGTEASVWPEKWPLPFLLEERHTRSFRKNMENDPLGYDGDYWAADDFQYGPLPANRTALFIDPAVTTRTTSDETGYAVVGWNKPSKTCVVRYADSYRHSGRQIRTHVLKLLERFPEIRLVQVEANQGGDTWHDVLHDLPVKLTTPHVDGKKEVRAIDALHHYQKHKVWHEQQFQKAEQQMVTFPRALHDDLVDAVGAGVRYFLGRPEPVKKYRSETTSYV